MKILLTKKNLLNNGQKEIYNTIIDAVNEKSNQKIFFIDSPGGYGKTFLFNMMLAEIRLQNQIAIAVASSEIAALLLNGGRTAHSRFKIPIPIIETSTLNISKNSELADLIRMAKLIIWDEALMVHRYIFEAVDRTFKDLTDNSDEPFRGKIIVMEGDFRQILHIVIREKRAYIVNACIKSSNLWRFIKVMHLTENMRVQDIMQKQFVDYLLKIGERKETIHENIGENIIQLPNKIIFDENDTIVSFISKIFYNLNENYSNDQTYVDYIKDRAILTPKNEDVDSINEQIINIFPGEAKEFLSADSVEDKDEVHLGLYLIEFLNTLIPSGTPPHRLILKKGVPIILLRNLSTTEGLCNGIRLIVRKFNKHVIDAEILIGSHLGKRVFIPRISITPSDTELPFKLICRQFPIRLAFAMSINKAQGQTIPYMGLYLPNPVFTHGQLYVALSRVQSKDNFWFWLKMVKLMKILIPKILYIKKFLHNLQFVYIIYLYLFFNIICIYFFIYILTLFVYIFCIYFTI